MSHTLCTRKIQVLNSFQIAQPLKTGADALFRNVGNQLQIYAA